MNINTNSKIDGNIDFDAEFFSENAEPIQHLIDNIDVTEIYIDSWDRISYMEHGVIKADNSTFANPQKFIFMCDHLTKDVRDRGNNQNYFSIDSSASHRFSIYTPKSRTADDEYKMTIRLFRAAEMSVERMIHLRAFTQEQFDIILDYAMKGRNILICGKPNSGKTTILRCLINTIIRRIDPRIISLEDPPELKLYYNKGFELEVDHREEDSASNALRFCLRNSPQILVLGEILDPGVARTFLESVEAGNSGAISTIHSKNAQVATSRLATLAAKGVNVSRSDWLKTADSTIDLAVYVSFDQITGRRMITELWDVRKQDYLDVDKPNIDMNENE